MSILNKIQIFLEKFDALTTINNYIFSDDSTLFRRAIREFVDSGYSLEKIESVLRASPSKFSDEDISTMIEWAKQQIEIQGE